MWKSVRFRLSWPQFVGDSGSGLNRNLAAVNKRATRSLYLNVLSATFSGIQCCSSSLQDKSYGPQGDWPDPAASVEAKRLLLEILLCFMAENRPFLARYSFYTYFRNASWYWVVYEVSSSASISMTLSYILHDHNFRKERRIYAGMKRIPEVGVTLSKCVDSFRLAFRLPWRTWR